jgi:hypothetical protein
MCIGLCGAPATCAPKPTYAWEMIIFDPGDRSSNLVGAVVPSSPIYVPGVGFVQGWEYAAPGASVNAVVQNRTSSTFAFNVTQASPIKIGFQGLTATLPTKVTQPATCQFPTAGSLTDADQCVFGFLNGVHPAPPANSLFGYNKAALTIVGCYQILSAPVAATEWPASVTAFLQPELPAGFSIGSPAPVGDPPCDSKYPYYVYLQSSATDLAGKPVAPPATVTHVAANVWRIDVHASMTGKVRDGSIADGDDGVVATCRTQFNAAPSIPLYSRTALKFTVYFVQKAVN